MLLLVFYLIKQGKTNDLRAINFYEEFDPGSERTLVACLMHASRASRGQP